MRFAVFCALGGRRNQGDGRPAGSRVRPFGDCSPRCVLNGAQSPTHLTEHGLAGDTIEFTFQLPGYVKNGTDAQHTATQSTFEAPCTPKEGGFDTGLQTTTMTGGKSFTLLVRTPSPSAPIFDLNGFASP